MDEAQLVDHGHRRPGDPADRAGLAGDAPRVRPARPAAPSRRRARAMPRRKSAGARGPTTSDERALPPVVERWFEAKGWRPRRHQLEMLDLARRGRSALLVAATGAGKTLAGFLPTICELAEQPSEGLHTLYVSPLKALAVDVQRNLIGPIEEMGLPIRVETRTGDTPSDRKARQRVKPPQVLLTTPESLSLLLSYPDAPQMFEELEDDRRRRAARLRQGKARRPAVAVDVAAAEARARAAPRRPVGDDQRPRRLSLVARAGRRHGAGRPRHRRSRRRARPFDPDPREQDPVGRPFRLSCDRRRDAADRAAQDDARLLQHARPRRADLPETVGRERPGAADRHPPRQPVGRGAAQGRGGDGRGQAARPGRDRQPRPRHRLGRRRPRRPDGRAQGQLAAAAADRPRQPPARRAEQGHHRPRQPLRISRSAAPRSTRSTMASSTPRSSAPERSTCSPSTFSRWRSPHRSSRTNCSPKSAPPRLMPASSTRRSRKSSTSSPPAAMRSRPTTASAGWCPSPAACGASPSPAIAQQHRLNAGVIVEQPLLTVRFQQRPQARHDRGRLRLDARARRPFLLRRPQPRGRAVQGHRHHRPRRRRSAAQIVTYGGQRMSMSTHLANRVRADARRPQRLAAAFPTTSANGSRCSPSARSCPSRTSCWSRPSRTKASISWSPTASKAGTRTSRSACC